MDFRVGAHAEIPKNAQNPDYCQILTFRKPLEKAQGSFFRLQLFQFWPKKPAPTFDGSGYSWLNFETKKLLLLFDFI